MMPRGQRVSAARRELLVWSDTRDEDRAQACGLETDPARRAQSKTDS